VADEEHIEFSPHERAAMGRLLEATREALLNHQVPRAERHRLVVYLITVLDQAALAVRQGYRAHLLDRLTADLDRFVAELVGDHA
jgi:hypothetical protein